MKPSKEQKEVIDYDENIIVTASPGTGKTTTLAWKVIELLRCKEKPEDILCITFTYKAKKEMLDKIYKFYKDRKERKEIPEVNIAKINIHTFHSFAFNHLLDKQLIEGEIVGENLLRLSILHSFEKNKAMNYGKEYIISDIIPTVERAINHIKSFGIFPDKINISKSSRILEKNHNEKSSYSINEMKFFLRYFIDAFKEYEKAKGNKIDYADMLSIFTEKFQDGKIKHVLVDEMQDMNKLETKIAEMISEKLFLVGDPKQAIFAFQGGSIKNLKELKEKHKIEGKDIGENRRSYQEIVNYSKEYFSNNAKDKEQEYGIEEFRSNKTDPSIEIPKVISTSAPIKSTLEIIRDWKCKKITRVNSQIDKISKFLGDNGVNYSISPDKDIPKALGDNKDVKYNIITKTDSQIDKISKFLKDNNVKYSISPEKNIKVVINCTHVKIGIITRTNNQIDKISKFLDDKDIKYTSTSQAIAQHAKQEIQRYLKGLLSDKIEDKISAAFTVFSSYSLREAFEMSRAFKDKDYSRLDKIRQWGIKLQREELDNEFKQIIFPMCVAKESKWFATAMSVKKQIDEYLTYDTPTFEELFDFIAIGERPYIEQGSESDIVLTTVHKAKGLEFDTVIYLPSTHKKTSFIDNIVKCIFEGCGVNVKEELDEPLRIDFVAITRAKRGLVIITNEKEASKYHIDGLSEIKIDDSKDEMVSTKSDNRQSKAYSLFLRGEFDESKKLLKAEDDWLRGFIKNYFQNIDHFSYSSIKTDPYEFLKNNIINIPSYYEETRLGSKVHKAMQLILTEKAKIEDYTDDVKRAVQNGLDTIEELKRDYPGLKLINTEEHLDISIDKMTDYDDDVLLFKGIIDAVFEHDQGYLIVDYKTDKRNNKTSEHKRQLAVYKRMLSILKDIPEEQITTCVVFVALRGGVNTGKFEKETSKGTKDVYKTFEKHLKTVLEWKQDPQKFICALLEHTVKNNKDELLLSIVKEKLKAQ